MSSFANIIIEIAKNNRFPTLPNEKNNVFGTKVEIEYFDEDISFVYNYLNEDASPFFNSTTHFSYSSTFEHLGQT